MKSDILALDGSSDSESDGVGTGLPPTARRTVNSTRLSVDDVEVIDGSESWGGVIDEGSSSDWEESSSEDAKINDKPYFQRVDSGAKRNTPASLITTMLHQNARPWALTSPDTSPRLVPHTGSSKDPKATQELHRMSMPLDINPSKSQKSQHNTSALEESRTTRRTMLANELSSSLRKQLLWERSHKSQTANARLKRRHSDVGTSKEQQEKVHMSGQILEDDSCSFLAQGLTDYHSKGW